MRTPPLVKICGVTRAEDARLAADLGAAFLGLNFYPPSPRSLTPQRAAAVADAVRGRVRLVGVFVDRPPAEVAAIDRAVGLDVLQFHGEEGPVELARHGPRAWKVVRVPPGASPPRSAIERELAAYPGVGGFLLDVRHDTLPGGTGETWAWHALAGLETSGRPLLVAGGIRPGNVRRALAASGAAGVDACSGVESAPGVKDPVLLERLMTEVFAGAAISEEAEMPGGRREDG
ncbi:MAG TPA: phosphoribosylanthranilate isomerase [Thermoanaerobaculia bacterium]|nr:phosphoribosylanthranilate isomerase [Thermoanaerobaculia bacterium]